MRPKPFAKGETRHQISMLQEALFLKVHIGEENVQVDRCRLYLGRRNICAGHVTRAASSVGQHDRASPPSMRRGYAHDQRQMRHDIRPAPRPPRSHPQTLISTQSRGCECGGYPRARSHAASAPCITGFARFIAGNGAGSRSQSVIARDQTLSRQAAPGCAGWRPAANRVASLDLRRPIPTISTGSKEAGSTTKSLSLLRIGIWGPSTVLLQRF